MYYCYRCIKVVLFGYYLKGFAPCRRPPPLDLPCFFSRLGLSSSTPEQLSTYATKHLSYLFCCHGSSRRLKNHVLEAFSGVQMASWRPLGGLLGGLGAVLAALRAPVNDLDGSGRLLETLRSALSGLWRALGPLLEVS